MLHKIGSMIEIKNKGTRGTNSLDSFGGRAGGGGGGIKKNLAKFKQYYSWELRYNCR